MQRKSTDPRTRLEQLKRLRRADAQKGITQRWVNKSIERLGKRLRELGKAEVK
jgi:hypothetical protein